MVDINTIIYPVLSELVGIALISNDFPDTESVFPMVSVTEISSISERIADGEEILSDVVFQIDVWDKRTDEIQNRQRCENISADVSAKLIETGFRRSFSHGTDESDIFRKCMRFSGQIDEKHKIIHRR